MGEQDGAETTLETDGAIQPASRSFGLRALHLASRRCALASCLLVVALGWFAEMVALAAAGYAARLGPAAATQRLQLVFPLKVDSAGLKQFALTVSTPGSPHYGQYESVPALARRFGASPTTRRHIVDYLRAHNARDVKVDATGLFAQATMNVAVAERLFAAPLLRFRAADRSRYIAPATKARIPAALTGVIEGVVGLDTKPLFSRPELKRQTAPAASDHSPLVARAADQQSSELPRTGTPSGCAAGRAASAVGGDPTTAGFTPNQYLTAYHLDQLHKQGYSGQGQRVALVETDGFKPSDIYAFAACFGLDFPAVTRTYYYRALAPGSEATLDLELLDAAAPHLQAIDVYEASRPVELPLALAGATVFQPKPPQVISLSFGLCDSAAIEELGFAWYNGMEAAIEIATASGVTVVSAAGDSGSAACEGASRTPSHSLATDFPASSAWVTAVGGTNLSLTPSNQIADQLVWNDTPLRLTAGGGGLSYLPGRPLYQKGVVASNSRSVPDVSMLADIKPGYAIYCTASDCRSSGNRSPWLAAGGTSAATPLLAGGLAVIDQGLRHQQRSFLGLINPLLYAIGRSASRSSVFDDVTRVGNDIGAYIPGGGGQPLGCCTATSGYDEASGWGSIDFTGFERRASQLLPKLSAYAPWTVPARQHPIKRKEIVATVSCAYACRVAADAKVVIGRMKPLTVRPPLYRIPLGGSRTVRFKFSRAQLGKLRAALTKHAKISATMSAVIVGPAEAPIYPDDVRLAITG